MGRVPAFMERWFDVFWHDPKAPVEVGKRTVLAVAAFAGAFTAAFPQMFAATPDLIEPLRWLGMTLSTLAGWGNSKSKPVNPSE